MPSKKSTVDNEETTGTLKRALRKGIASSLPYLQSWRTQRERPISRQEGGEKQRGEADGHIFPKAGLKPALGLG